MRDIELDGLRASEIDLNGLLTQSSKKPPRHRATEPFLKGPIPWAWLQRAMQLPGKALHVALLLWREAGCRRSRTVRFRLAGASDYGVHPDTAKRGLRALENAGLVAVQHYPGRALEVTLLPAPSEGQA